jgi:hypothetical protein
MLNELKNLEKNIGLGNDAKKRLEDRENCYLRLGYKDVAGKTKAVIDDERKKVVIDNLT